MGNTPGSIAETGTRDPLARPASPLATKWTRFDPYCKSKADLVDDLLGMMKDALSPLSGFLDLDNRCMLTNKNTGQIVRRLHEADATCPALDQARRDDGSVDRRAMFMALDEQLRQRRPLDLPRRVDGFWSRIIMLFGDRYPYLYSMKRPMVGMGKDVVKPILEADLIHASRCWPSRLQPSDREANGKRKAVEHHRLGRGVKSRALQRQHRE